MKRSSSARFAIGVAALVCAAAATAEAPAARSRGIGEYRSADPGAPPVTADNIMDSELFWPFRVELVRDYAPPGSETKLPRIPGVLVRVNPDGTVRIDYARRGRHEVPIDATNLISEANRIRLGDEQKMAPNLVLTIHNKLLDPSYAERFETSKVLGESGSTLEPILCVFADPDADGFEALADELRGLSQRPGLHVVLFPLTQRKDAKTIQRLREIGWQIPFVRTTYSAAYHRSLAGAQAPLPELMLLTQEGRLLYRGGPGEGVADEIVAALPDGAGATAARTPETASAARPGTASPRP